MKARFLFLAAVVLGLASCQTEPEGLDVNVGGEEQIVTVNVNVPETETRAAGSNSAAGAFANGVLGTAEDNTTMRYILQVYYKDGENFVKSEERKVEYSDGKSVAFDVRLVPERDYQFVVWADVVVNGKTDTDNHYNTADLTNVTLNNTWVAMDESRDAFTATEFIDNFNSSKVINITLKRPFAKLRVVTTDMKALNNLGIVPTKATVTYTEKHYDAFNAFAGKAINDSKNRDIKHENFAIASYGETGDNMTLFTDYFFAEDDATNFVLEVFDQNNQIIKSGEFTTDIYVKRNNLTTIKGNILTDGKGFDVIIDDAFAGESGKDDGETFANVDTAEELLDAINKGVENITLDGDIDLSDLLSAGTLSTRAGEKFGLTIAADKKFSIDLNGFTLSGESATAGDAMITNNGELNIVNGTVTYKYSGEADSTYGKGNYTIVNNGKLTVNANINIIAGTEGEKFRHALYVIQNAGELVVDGGMILNNTNIAIRNWVGSETKPSNITLNDGEIKGLRGIWNQLPNNNANLAPKANIVINGGTLTGTAIDGTQDSDNILAIYSYTYGNQAKNVCIEVNGGTINGDIALTGGSNKNFVEKVTINGGKFNGRWGDVYSYADDALAKDAITIKGGEFSSIAPLVYLNGAEEGFKLLKDIELTDETYTFTGVGTLDLNGKTLSAINTVNDKTGDGKIDANDNAIFIDVRGNLTLKNGTVTFKHNGDNFAWNASTNLFNVTAGGVLNLEGVTAKNLGGSDMAFVAHLNNWGEVTLNVENSTLESTYIAVRVFNSGNDMNNVTIKNSTLKGKYCFWVHNYTKEDFGTEEKALAHQALLNFDIFNGTNTFEFTNSYGAAALYGFTNSIYFTADGNQIVADGFVMNAEGEYLITKMSGMSWFANEVNVNKNDFAGEIIKLAAAMDLNNENWTAIGTPDANFRGTFDGCDYTIKNLKILVSEGKEDKAYLGFFGYAKDATIKNVVFENVDINVACLDIDHSQGHIGAVAGSLEGTSTIENVTVKGDVKVEATFDANGASRVAVVAGGNAYGNVTMKNVRIVANEGSYLKANNNVGALAGQLQGKSVFEDCSSNIDVTGKKFFAGGIIGLAAGDQTFTNCHTSGDITITQGREGKAHDHFRVGGIAGGWADNVKTPLVVTNCSYTGKVSGKDFNGNEANPLDYAGYVGRGYTLANAGTTVNIDGTRYVQKYDGADKAGIYDVYDADGNLIVADGVAMNAKGEYLISKAAGLTWFSDQMNNKKNTFAGKTIKVVNDIDMAGVTYYGGSIASYPSYCFKGTFDGGEKVISNLTITVENDIYGAAALIPTLSGDGTTIKNVTLRDVNISSSHYAGGIWGYTTSDNCWINITNCHVEGGTITGNICNGDNADKVGGIGGIFYDGIVSGCSVKGVTITGYRDTAGIVGWAADSRAKIKNNSIENVTINVNNATNYKEYTKRSEYDVNNYVGEGVGIATLEGNTGEATINWGSIAE